ncbi:MAG TPA: chemotaxis protein CheA [Synergistaceae bacterium]|nr:chemotaxis protein CheA [Synergistaceae bacterium]HPQ36523.1 chemotaxis protein CheA [Synergistaceae bacterium]
MTSMDMSQYIGAFLDEATEQLQNLNDLLLSLENDPQNEEIVTEIFRIAHTLKGMSATMGFEKIAHLTHAMEDMFDLVRKREIDLQEEDVTLLFGCLDRLTAGVESIREGEGEAKLDIDSLAEKIHNRISGAPQEEELQDAEENAQIPLTSQEKEWVHKAHSQGLEMYKIVVFLENSCLLKAARAYMALSRAGDLGDVIKTVPSVEELEQESFKDGFVLYLATIASESEIQETLERISEVKKVTVELISDLDLEEDTSSAEEKTLEEDLEHSMDLEEEDSLEEFKKKAPKKDLSGGGKAPSSDSPKRSAPTGGRTVRVDLGRLDKLMNLVGELVIGRARIERLAMEAKLKDFDEPLSQLGRISGEIQELVTKLRMVPVSFVFDRFPRIVRDLSKNMGKEIDLVIEGKETELDRTVIDEIGDPMVHLIRNAVDHGVETPEERRKANKPKQGTVFIAAYQEGNGVIIEVRDDGKGIDTKVVRKKAVERGMLTAEEAAALTEEEAIRLVFLPGFSTAKEVTDVSGRGVGMDAVKSKVESLGGQFQVESAVGKGTRVLIRLPLTLAIVLALLIQVGEEIYAISLENVEETLLVQKDEIKYVHGTPVTNVRGEILSLKKLSAILQSEVKDDEAQEYPVVVVKLGRNRVGFIVDELVGQQEIVIKPLGKLLSKVRGMAGATILGDGNVALILDVASLHAAR